MNYLQRFSIPIRQFSIILLLILICNFTAKAQNINDVKYRRSSLHLILIESENFPNKETVIKAYNTAPFPDKYNKHNIDLNTLDPKKFSITKQDRDAFGIKKSGMRKFGTSLLSGLTDTELDTNGIDMPIIIDKYLKNNRVANKLIAKWFSAKPNGAFNMSLIGERGFYDATEMETNIAKGSARGILSLADAGEELINNTYIVFTKLQFMSNEPIAASIKLVAETRTAKLPIMLQKAANTAIEVAYNKAKEGYSVWTTSYLYKLKWNEEVASTFYNNYWMDDKSVNPKKKLEFENSNEFEMEYIGSEKSSTLVTFSLKSKRSEQETIILATNRNNENVFAKLQKEYEVFKPKTPLYSGDPITAKIGIKEGIEGGDKFEVLEQTQDPTTGLTKYIRKGIITVDKNNIWDNRFSLGDEEDAGDKSKVDRTTFKGGNKYFAGMLIRQIK